MADTVLKSYRFRAEREGSWRELESLLERVQKGGIRSLGQEELNRLPLLYRATLSSLSVARAISLDRALVAYLEALAGRAYFAVYGTRRGVLDLVRDFLGSQFPQMVRRYRWHCVVAALALGLGVLVGMQQTLADEERFYSFVPESMAQGRDPTASTADLRSGLYAEREDDEDRLGMFASFLFSNNARVGMMAFALGFAFGVPVLVVLFWNGLMLGAMAALFQSRGLGLDFWAWVLPHGVTELGAIVLCGGAGLVLGQSLLQPGRHTRLHNLARRGRQAGQVVLGAVVMLFAAALIEGFFRQLVTDVPIRLAVVAGTLGLWALYFGSAGRSQP